MQSASSCIPFGRTWRAEPRRFIQGSLCLSQQSPDSRDTELLVDADNKSIAEIQAAIAELRRLGHVVKATVFAEPGRERNKKWKQLFSQPGVVFRAVVRNSSTKGEANDDAIAGECLALETCRSSASISLLVSDMGYLDNVCQMSKKGMAVTVLVPARELSVIRRYRSVGVQVISLGSQHDNFTTVRAMLHQDGSGQVELAEPIGFQDMTEDFLQCVNLLQDLGFVQAEGEYVVHAAAKFWRANSLGALAVYPQQLTVKTLSRLIISDKNNRQWFRHLEKLAIVIPIASSSTMSKKDKQKYGSRLAKQVFKGGGPFMLHDSKDMVQQVLTKLAFLDGDMNADLAEAMLVFSNAPENQYQLRKNLNLLPAAGDTIADVEEKLRHAFLSHLTSGRWRFAPRDRVVRTLLRKDGLLTNDKAEAVEVFGAMAKYSQRHRLPRMKTYNGYVFRILRAFDSNPAGTGTLELAGRDES